MKLDKLSIKVHVEQESESSQEIPEKENLQGRTSTRKH